MRTTSILICLALIVVPLSASASSTPSAGEQGQWAPPQIPPPPSPRYPPPGVPPWTPAPVLMPMGEQEWGQWLLRSQAEARNCTRIAFISGSVAAAGFALTMNYSRTPPLNDLAAGRTGKMATFGNTVGMLSVVGGGLALMGSAKCAGYNSSLAQQLEREGRRRGFGPPTPEPLNERAWLQRLASERSTAWMGKWATIAGGLAMAAGGAAIYAYDPRPDQRGAARLGPGIALFSIGYASSIIGSAMWANHSRLAREIAATPPKRTAALQIAPIRRGLRTNVVIAF